MSKEQEVKEGTEEELIIVEGDPSGAPPDNQPAAKDDKSGQGEDDDEGDDEGEGEGEGEGESNEDTRTATDADADNDQARQRKRKSSKERRARQKAYAERRERELNYYASRNEELEKKFSELEARQRRAEGITIGQAINQVDAQIKEAERLEAEAIKAQNGEAAVEARSIRDSLQNKRDRLVVAADRAKQPPASTGPKTPPPEMQAAISWIDRNKAWYDPKGGNEDSVIAQAIEDRLTREGKFNAATDEFWDELDRRLQARGVGKRSGRRVQDDDLDDDDDDDDQQQGRRSTRHGQQKAPTKNSGGGPKVTVNGSQRSLKANEVYVSPERKKAMQEAGVWDDPVLRQKLLKRYHEYDRNAGNNG